MSHTYVNNFRFLKVYDTPPPQLQYIEEHENFILYHSQYNELVYIAHDQDDGLYHAFENNGLSKNAIEDLKVAIKVRLNKN